MKTKLLLFALIISALACPAQSLPTMLWRGVNQSDLYQAGEATVSVFGTYNNAERGEFFRTSKRHGQFGAGLGVQAFPQKNLGLEANFDIPDANRLNGELFNHTTFSGIARLPIGPVAPYVKAGVGHNWQDSPLDWSTHVGGGVEVRYNRHAGLFAEVSYEFNPNHQPDNALWLFGARFAFD